MSLLSITRQPKIHSKPAAAVNTVADSVATSRERLSKVQGWLKSQKLDAALFVNPNNIRYLTGLATAGADPEEIFLVVAPDHVSMYTSPFYKEKAERMAPHIPLTVPDGKSLEPLRDFVTGQLKGVKSLGVEGSDMSAYRASWLKAALPGVALKFIHEVENLRTEKSPAEIREMRQAIDITRKGMESVAGKARPGATEKELVETFKQTLLKNGADEAFTTIIAAGPHGAEPHFDEPGEKPLKDGDVLVMDVGARVNGFNSDITRMIVIGKASPEVQKILDLVEKAQATAIAKVAPGVPACEIDRAARDVIDKAGYGKNFYHSTGHGVGEDVHERPAVAPERPVSNVLRPPEEMAEPPSFLHKLEPGDVITVEPGVYLTGKFGVRMEDMILVTPNGHEVLSGYIPKIFHAQGKREGLLARLKEAWHSVSKRFRTTHQESG